MVPGYRYPYTNGSNLNIGFGLSDIANPNLKWESTAQSDLGVDVSLFKGRLTSTIDVYRKVTDNLLMPSQLPDYVGVSSVIDNIGSVENKGIEILVGGDPIVGKFRWNTSFNISINRNKVLDLGPGLTKSDTLLLGGGYNLGIRVYVPGSWPAFWPYAGMEIPWLVAVLIRMQKHAAMASFPGLLTMPILIMTRKLT